MTQTWIQTRCARDVVLQKLNKHEYLEEHCEKKYLDIREELPQGISVSPGYYVIETMSNFHVQVATGLRSDLMLPDDCPYLAHILDSLKKDISKKRQRPEGEQYNLTTRFCSCI